MDTEKLIQGVTVGIVAGLVVYWVTSSKHLAKFAGKNTGSGDYKPLYGDVRTVRFGSGTCACCQCCGLVAPENTTTPLAADYLCNAPQYAPSVSGWNLGVSLQFSCEAVGLHSCITRTETATSFPFGCGPRPKTTPQPLRLTTKINCQPNVCIPVCCTEIV
jgi:hypothetical protein